MKIVLPILGCVFGIFTHCGLAHAGDFHFDISDVTPTQSRSFQKQLIEDRKKLDQYFQANKFAEIFNGTIRVIVFNYRPPLPRTQEFWWIAEPYRGMFVIPALRVKQDQVVTIHEMTHIYAPNQAKMLTEGFAVYVQQVPGLGRLDVMPTFGKSLKENLKGCTTGLVNLRNFDLLSIPGLPDPNIVIHPPGGCRINEVSILGYLIAGSFVQFLIENYGLPKFKQLYSLTPMKPFTIDPMDPGRYQRVFGKSIDDLQVEWQGWIER